MKRRYTMWIMVILAFSLLAAACGDSDSGTEETTTTTAAETTTTEATTTTVAETTTTEALPPIVLWADEKRATALETVVPAFTEATGVDVEIVLVDFGSIREEVITKGPVGEGPDLFVGASDWVGELATNGALAVLDLGTRSGEFTEASVAALNYQGAQHGLPYATEAVALYYNMDLVTEAPATIEELTAACDAIEVESCLGIPGGNDAGDAYHHYPFISAEGGYIFAYDAATGFDVQDVGLASEGSIAGLTVLEGLIADGYVPSTNYDDAKNLFLEGSQAFWLTGPWELGTLNDQDTVNWGVTTLPTIDGQSMNPFVGVQGFFLSEFSENKALATEFLLNFIATPEAQLALFEADPRGAANIATLEAISDDPIFATFGASASTGSPLPNVPEMGAVWGPVGDNILAMRNGDIDAETAMTNAAEQVTTVINEG